MSPLRRIGFYWENPPTGAFVVEYEDTRRPSRIIRERYPARGFVSVGEAARITNTPRRTMYYWVEVGAVDWVKDHEGYTRIPLSEVRRLLEEE